MFADAFKDRRSQKNRLNDGLGGCLIVFQHEFHRQCLPQVKKRALLDSPHLSQNKKLFTFASTTRTESHGVITKGMNFNCPVVETSESIEANYYDLELSIVIPCTFLRSSNLNSLFGDRKLLASVCLLSLRWRKRKLKKKNSFSVVEDFNLLWRHLGTQNT